MLADWKSQAAAQPFARSSAQGVTDQLDDFAEAIGLSRQLVRHLGQSFAEDLSLAT
jgi:hypothetical protein